MAWLPQPQLPTGLAERVLEMMRQRAQNQPGVAVANAIKDIFAGGFAGAREKQAREQRVKEEQGKLMTTEQAVSMGLLPGQVPTGKTIAQPQPGDTVDGLGYGMAPKMVPETKSAQEVYGERPTEQTMDIASRQYLETSKEKARLAEEESKAAGKKHTITPEEMESQIGGKFRTLGWHAGLDVDNATYKAVIAPSGAGQQLNQEQISANVDSMVNGAPLSILGGRGTQKAVINAEYEKRRKQNPGLLTVQGLEQQQTAGMSRAKTLNSPQITNEIVAVDQYTAAIDAAIKLSDAIPRGKFIPLNGWKLKGVVNLYAADSLQAEEVAVLNTVISEVGMQSSRVFSGTAATDVVFQNELKRLNTAMTQEQFKKSAMALRQIAQARKQGILNSPTYLPANLNQPQTTNPNTAAGGTQTKTGWTVIK